MKEYKIDAKKVREAFNECSDHVKEHIRALLDGWDGTYYFSPAEHLAHDEFPMHSALGDMLFDVFGIDQYPTDGDWYLENGDFRDECRADADIPADMPEDDALREWIYYAWVECVRLINQLREAIAA